MDLGIYMYVCVHKCVFVLVLWRRKISNRERIKVENESKRGNDKERRREEINLSNDETSCVFVEDINLSFIAFLQFLLGG